MTAVLGRIRRAGERLRNAVFSTFWPPYTRLSLASDGADWVLAHEMRQVGRIANRLGARVVSAEHGLGARRQSVFFASQFVLLSPRAFGSNRIAIAYFHGRGFDDEAATFATRDAGTT